MLRRHSRVTNIWEKQGKNPPFLPAPLSPLSGVMPLMCQFGRRRSTRSFQATHSRQRCSSEHRFCSAGTGLPWHRNAAAQESPGELCRWPSSARPEQTHLAPVAAASPAGATLVPPPQGHHLLLTRLQPDSHKGQIALKKDKAKSSAHHPTGIAESCSTKPALQRRWGADGPSGVSHTKGHLAGLHRFSTAARFSRHQQHGKSRLSSKGRG